MALAAPPPQYAISPGGLIWKIYSVLMGTCNRARARAVMTLVAVPSARGEAGRVAGPGGSVAREARRMDVAGEGA